MKQLYLNHEFVEYIPNILQEGIIYLTTEYATAVHLCCCGCKKEVVTPLSPKDWKLTFDGETVSLHPSIGNWGFTCKSHYWVKRNKIEWVPSHLQNNIHPTSTSINIPTAVKSANESKTKTIFNKLINFFKNSN